MDLESNAHDIVAKISEEMKRKLNLLIALMGKADVTFLFLDFAVLIFFNLENNNLMYSHCLKTVSGISFG